MECFFINVVAWKEILLWDPNLLKVQNMLLEDEPGIAWVVNMATLNTTEQD